MRFRVLLFLEEFEMKRKIRALVLYFSLPEILLWVASVVLVLGSFFVFDRENYLTLVASLVGVTSLILNAKGNPLGQVLMVLFSVLYGVISYSFSYYGEMITYLGMTLPMAVLALISWLKNPFGEKRSEVKVSRLSKKAFFLILLVSALVTLVFGFILKALETANLALSTVSVTTSFLAVCLTFKRSRFFALAYAANDLVLIALWILAAKSDMSYFSVVICFAVFFVNDVYGFLSWSKMKKRQSRLSASKKENGSAEEEEKKVLRN